MKEIPVSKRNLIVAVILAVVIAVGILVIENWPLRTEKGSTASTNEDSLVSAAAVTAIEKIFQVNYQEGKDVWLNRICELSTPAGCEMFSAGAAILAASMPAWAQDEAWGWMLGTPQPTGKDPGLPGGTSFSSGSYYWGLDGYTGPASFACMMPVEGPARMSSCFGD
ncbi:MAG: hypothetical protein E4G99_02755, partial [Anaerolineales bacterium]